MAKNYNTIVVGTDGSASSLLAEAGYRQRTDHKDLTLVDEENGVEFFYLRPRDIAVYVGEGTLDIGITGRDLLLDSNADATEIKGLGFGHSRFRFAAPKSPQNTIEGLAGKRIATSYPGLLSAFLTMSSKSQSVVRCLFFCLNYDVCLTCSSAHF